MAEVSELSECTNIANKELILQETIHTVEGTIVESEEINKNEEIPHENDIDLNEDVSEDETNKLVINTEVESDNETEDLENSFTTKKKVKKLAIFDSDSENDDVSSEIAKSNSNVEQKRIGFIDSDSENDSNQDSNTNGISEYKSVDQINEMDQGEETSRNKKIISALCDPDSSDENNEDDQEKEEEISDSELKSLGNTEISLKSKRTKSTKKSEGKEKKMTAKQALEQRKEILAESQRRVRESRVSLPYHKPKARSLKEFLQNRPKLASPLGDLSRGGSPSLSIKMSMQQLEIITQKMKEREKEMKEFYKSESESENEEENSTKHQENTNENNSSASNTEENHSNELLNEENISEEKEEVTNEDNTNLMETEENSIENMKDQVLEEKSETIETEKDCEITSEEKTILEKDELKEDEHPETVNKENLNPELDVSMHEEPKIHENEEIKETDTKQNDNLVILENILVAPSKPSSSEKIYNLDAELSELASEVQKDEYESYEFNLDGIEEESETLLANGDKKKKDTTESIRRRSEILEKIGELKPRLSVGPNQMIDLENGVAMPDEISRLRERFIKHNLKLSKNSHRKDISILSVSGGELHKETLSLKVGEDEDENMKPLEKPGVRLQKLREELQHQMAQRRSNLWKEKLTNKNKTEKLEEDDNDEKSESDAKDILDNEEEEDFTDPEEEDDEELEENDCDMSENKRTKSDFIDEEAEESEIEEIDEEENLLTEKECNEENDEIEEDMEDNESIIEESVPKKKVLKRIIKAFDEDSDDEMETNDTFPTIAENKRINIGSDNDDLLEDLPRNNFVTRQPVLSSQKSEDNFATPVTYMTGLKNLNTSGSRFVPPENVAMEDDETCGQSEVRDSEKQNTEETQQSQMLEESNSLSTQDVLDICSGQFPSSSRSNSSPEITTQQLKEVFTGSMKSSLAFDTQDVEDICSGGFTGASQPPPTQEKEVVLDHNDEHLISQLIDEDELENFKKKFESPGVNAASTKKHPLEGVGEVVGTGGLIDSDDDDEGDGLKLKNRRSRRLAFSDDEESSTSEAAQEEAIDLQDDEDPASDVEYDSEENEIEEQAEITEENNKEKLKASDFFENEAELSESEWGSEDEDERNLDDLEFEKGDEEKFDEDKLRTDIEKIQMRQMLDEDNREVKMLQELLLEDGELHGTGRQRQFRWKNIDAATNDGEEKKNDDDDDVYLDEDESEEQWRKERHEREMLRLKKESQEEDSLIADSQSLTFTHRSLKIKSQTGLSSQVSLSEVDVSPKVKQPFTLLNKRGSFLSRGEKILQKIAETSKVSFAAKNTNRIVFQTIDEDTKKRKASSANLGDSTPVALKKLRLSGLSPGLNNGRSKKLFEKILQDK